LREHGPDAIKKLARLAKDAQSEQARISACNALLDRAYGRSQATQLIEIEFQNRRRHDCAQRNPKSHRNWPNYPVRSTRPK
jgi:hypothetical protein